MMFIEGGLIPSCLVEGSEVVQAKINGVLKGVVM
jgi:hypothetical protein